MTVHFVGAGPGDPELLTCKAANILRQTHCCIFAGSLVNPEILELLPKSALRYDSAGMTLEEIVEVIQEMHAEQHDVTRLHTGDPSLYGAIAEQMNVLDKLGIPYSVVPGVSSFQAAAAALKLELTLPEVSQTVILTRVAGRTPVPETQEMERLAATRSTLCIFLSIGQIEELAKKLIQHYGETCPVGVVFRASWPDEKIICGQLDDIAEKVRGENITRTAMILVGDALDRTAATASRLYDKHFTHGYRKGENS